MDTNTTLVRIRFLFLTSSTTLSPSSASPAPVSALTTRSMQTCTPRYSCCCPAPGPTHLQVPPGQPEGAEGAGPRHAHLVVLASPVEAQPGLGPVPRLRTALYTASSQQGRPTLQVTVSRLVTRSSSSSGSRTEAGMWTV